MTARQGGGQAAPRVRNCGNLTEGSMAARVLLVEEDSTTANELSGSLRAIGCEVTRTEDGPTGLVRAVTERFDVILVSAELRGTSGFRVCNRIKKDPDARSTPLFVMGASRDQVEAHRALATQADRY